uniref:Homeobox-DDT domain protein RLT3 n=1 Tax=Ananas comosus var. bracteatus TaxID=296719 RepID=A0A6V7Q0H5_ANACO|nr:unnamed protein product [Ananas comosus var. bracteatus]
MVAPLCSWRRSKPSDMSPPPLKSSTTSMGNEVTDAKKDHGAKKKTPEQLQLLEKFYSAERYPNQKAMEEYAASVNLTYNQIRIWFVERRRKERRGEEQNILGMKDCQGGGRVHTYECSSKWSVNGRFLKHMHRVLGGQSAGRKRLMRLQILFPRDYILRKVFRKDGPPLGAEFDPLPNKEFDYRLDARSLRSCHDNKKTTKKRKIFESPIEETRTPPVENVPPKKHGIGKGLMTVSSAGSKETLPKDSSPRKPVSKRTAVPKRIEKKRKPPLIKRKVVPCGKAVEPQKSHATECKLSVDECQSSELENELSVLIDDEELELEELQAGPNPLRCSAHLASSGRHDCPLCKDLLARFPPQSVKMKQPCSTRPWDSSPELVKKLFKVVQFLYSNSISIDIHSFTFDEFAQAFHDKDSMLLGKVHVALLKLLLLDVEREKSGGFIPRPSKDCRFLHFSNFVREQEFDVNFWCQSLNSLTWIEILRQVLVAAGFGSKCSSLQRETFGKERNQMVKYGLRPRTLKAELFSLLAKKGSSGLKVSELARSSQIIDLDLPNTTEEIEQLICSTLSSDITLFEKIAPSAFRLRVDPHIKGKEYPQSDSDDSGSVDDESLNASTSSSSDSDDSEDMDSFTYERRIHRNGARKKKTCKKLTKYSEIDESNSGEAWVLGLMEGEYADLSIDEKLEALVALVDLVGSAGSCLRLEESARTTSVIPNAQHQRSGGKIKKSQNHHLLSRPTNSAEETNPAQNPFPADSSPTRSKGYQRGRSTCKRTAYTSSDSGRNIEAAEVSGLVVHQPQSIYLGSDRRYNNYWLFLGPCTTNDPGHRRVYFESSEDGHWEVIDTPQALLALLSVLDSRGRREARLVASLEKRQEFLCQAMKNFIQNENETRRSHASDPSDITTSSGDGSSPVSDIDNIVIPDSINDFSTPSGVIVLELGRKSEEKMQKWERLQAFDKWIWNSFNSVLSAVKYSRRSYMDLLFRCESCHDLYWRDEKHCRICHSTFEIDFDLEERYAVHAATCREAEDTCEFPKHKVLPCQLQALKAAIYAIEVAMPEMTLVDSWRKSAHKLWVKRLRRTSSLPELLQVLTDFVGAINEDWLYECASTGSNSSVDDIIINFQTMPQTISAVALWIVKLDTLIAPHLEKAHSDRTAANMQLSKRKRASTR